MKKLIDYFFDMIVELLNIFSENPIKLATNVLSLAFGLLIIALIWGLDDRIFILKLMMTVIVIDIPLAYERKRIRENEKKD